MGPVEYRIIDSIRFDEIKQLYIEAGWWNKEDEDDPTWIDRMLKGSCCFVAAFYENRIIGMGRAISDGISDAYIQDITVLIKFRGQGIGKRICQILVEELQKKGIRWIGLIAEPGTSSFYKHLGFMTLKAYVPMLLRQ